jgi:hypothetical protein
MNKTLSIAFALTLSVSAVLPALASAFWGGTVINIAATDTLKIRKWPAASSQIIDAYASGASISMTGRCKNIITNASFRVDAGGSANWKYSKMKMSNVWCQVITDNAQLGWARGKFIWPQ